MPHLLLDGGQGKTAPAHQFLEDGQATDWDTDGSDNDRTVGPGNNGEGAASDKTKAIGNRVVHPTHQRDCIHPSNTSLSTICVHLHPSEVTPIPKGSTPPPDESMMVNEVNLLVNGSSPVPVYCVRVAAYEKRVGGLNSGVQLAPNSLEGLHPPVLAAMGTLVTSLETNKLWLQNRWQCHALQDMQLPTSMWTMYLGSAILPPAQVRPSAYRDEMCTAGIATAHPVGDPLAEWSQLGCPTKTGKPWLKQEMWEAVTQGFGSLYRGEH